MDYLKELLLGASSAHTIFSIAAVIAFGLVMILRVVAAQVLILLLAS